MVEPFVRAVGTSQGDAVFQGGFLFGRLGLIDPLHPIASLAAGQGGQGDLLVGWKPALTGAGPVPCDGTFNQSSAKGISLDIPADGGQVGIVLDGEALVASLIDVPGAHLIAMNEPAANVADAQTHHEAGQVAVVAGPEHQMPVGGHHAVRQHPHGHRLLGLAQTALEGLVILA